ncbi:hypothetical protein ALI22I_41650 [Saccharothrix sp. ALI-22-I]|nr:hypothetical protein ALI22I_41650 [Saccharothrix sp. ALI-22-I]
MILTAGRSAELGHVTADRPASLVEVCGDTLIRRQKAALRRAGVWRIGAVVGWRTDGFHGTDLTLFENPLWASTTSLDSLAVADDWLRRVPVMVQFGNVLCSAETIRRLCTAPGPLAVAYDPGWRALGARRCGDPWSNAEPVVLDRSRRYVAQMGGRPASLAVVQGQWLRLVKLTPASWAVLRRMRDTGQTEGLGVGAALAQLVRHRLVPVTAVPSAGPWFPFDNPTDLEIGRDVVDELDGSATARSHSA